MDRESGSNVYDIRGMTLLTVSWYKLYDVLGARSADTVLCGIVGSVI